MKIVTVEVGLLDTEVERFAGSAGNLINPADRYLTAGQMVQRALDAAGMSYTTVVKVEDY